MAQATTSCRPTEPDFDALPAEMPAPSGDAPSSLAQTSIWRTSAFQWLAGRPLVVLAVAFLVWGLTDVRSRGRVDAARPGVHRTDFTVYTEAGAAFYDGRDPYGVTNPRGWGYLYPPLFALLVAPLHALAPQWQVFTWFLLSLLMLWGCYRESQRVLGLILADCQFSQRGLEPYAPDRRESGGPLAGTVPFALPRWIAMAAVATVALPALNCLQRGQVGVLKTYLLLLGLRWLLESRSWRKAFAAGCVFAAPIALKITPLLPVGLLVAEQVAIALRERVWRRSPLAAWRARRRLAIERACGSSLGLVWGLLACFLLIPAALVGSERNLQSLERWRDLVATKAQDPGYDLFAGNSYSVQNQSLLNATRHLGNWLAYEFAGGSDDRLRVAPGDAAHVMDAVAATQTLGVLRTAMAVLAVWLAWHAARLGDRLTLAAVFGLACVATLIVSPIGRSHYYILTLPAVLWVPLAIERAGRTRLAQWLAWSPAALTVSHYLLPGLAARVGLLGIGITVWFVAAAIALLAATRERSRSAEGSTIWSFRVRGTEPDPGERLAELPPHRAGLAADATTVAKQNHHGRGQPPIGR